MWGRLKAPPKPDYRRIQELERELGIGPDGPVAYEEQSREVGPSVVKFERFPHAQSSDPADYERGVKRDEDWLAICREQSRRRRG